jgi:hypothetical protein
MDQTKRDRRVDLSVTHGRQYSRAAGSKSQSYVATRYDFSFLFLCARNSDFFNYLSSESNCIWALINHPSYMRHSQRK